MGKLFILLLCFQENDLMASSVLTQDLTGQMGFVDADYCITCGEKGAEKCPLCKAVSQCLNVSFRDEIRLRLGHAAL